MANPIVVDTYQRVMAPAFDERDIIGNSTVFQTMFSRAGGSTIYSPNAEDVTLDVIRGNEKTAKLRVRGSGAEDSGDDQKSTIQQRFSRFDRVFPLIEQEGTLRANQLNKAIAGEAPYSPLSKSDRARVLAMKAHQEHFRMIIRKQEVLAAQMYRTGIMNVNESGSEQITYPRDSNLTETLTNQWTNTTLGTPLSDLKDACIGLRTIGKVNADYVIMGISAFDAFINHPDVATAADNRRLSYQSLGFDNGKPMNPSFADLVNAGLAYQGWVKIAGWDLQVFTYYDIYETDAGVATDYMPKGEVVVGSSRARYDRYFGPGELTEDSIDNMVYRDIFGIDPMAAGSRLPMNTKNAGLFDPRMFICSAVKDGNRGYKIMTQTAPIYGMTQVDSVYRITNAA